MITCIEASPFSDSVAHYFHPLIDACVQSASEEELRKMLNNYRDLGIFDGSSFTFGFGNHHFWVHDNDTTPPRRILFIDFENQ